MLRRHSPLTPTQVVQLQHGDGRQTQVVVWPRPESNDPAKALKMERTRYLAGSHTPSAHGYHWPAGSRGEAKSPNFQSPHSPRSPNTRPSSAPASPAHHRNGAMLLATESIKVRTVAASSMMPEVPRCALNNALEDAARSREASLDADRKALGLVQRMAWPTTESCRWAQQLVERVVASSSRLQAATEATERAVLIAHEAHASEGRKQLDVEILRGRGVLKERDAVDTVWRREMRAMETSQRSEVLQMRSEWQAGTSRLRSRAAFESKEQRLETAEHISRITSLQAEVSSLQTQLATVQAEGQLATAVARSEQSAHLGASRQLHVQQAAELARAVQSSGAEMTGMRRDLAAANDEIARLREVVAAKERGLDEGQARLDALQQLKVTEVSRLQRKIDQLRGMQRAAGAFGGLLLKVERRAGSLAQKQAAREEAMIDQAIVAASYDPPEPTFQSSHRSNACFNAQQNAPPSPGAPSATPRLGMADLAAAAARASKGSARSPYAALARAPAAVNVDAAMDDDDDDDLEDEEGASTRLPRGARPRPVTAPGNREQAPAAARAPFASRPFSAKEPVVSRPPSSAADEG